MKILNFGSCNLDFVYSLHHIVEVGETQTTYSLNTFPGGKGLNQSIALARAGVQVYHAGCIGEDGQMLRDVLNDSGVDTTYLRIVEGKNGHAVIQVSDNGENSIFLYPGSNEKVDKAYIDKVLSDFSSGDIILLQNEISHVPYIIEQAYKKGMCIVLNPSPYNSELASIDISMLSYLILNEGEAKQMTGRDEPYAALMYFASKYPCLKVMLTLGSKGCIYKDAKNELSHPIFDVKVVDTTAAGDTFTGYFVAGVANGEDHQTVLKNASCASALSVMKNGAAPSIPLRGEVMAALKILSLHKKKKTSDIEAKIEQYLSANMTCATIDGLSKALGYSKVYTGKIVKESMGMSFSDLLKTKRCEKASELLLSTDLPVSKIISETGYANETFFRRTFKQIYGKKPLEYRKNRG